MIFVDSFDLDRETCANDIVVCTLPFRSKAAVYFQRAQWPPRYLQPSVRARRWISAHLRRSGIYSDLTGTRLQWGSPQQQFRYLPLDVSGSDEDTQNVNNPPPLWFLAGRRRKRVILGLFFCSFFHILIVMDDREYGKWPVARLKKELRLRGAVVHGKKKDLVER